MIVGDKKQRAPKALLNTPIVLDGRAIPAWGMVLTSDLLSPEVRGLSAVALRLWLCLIAVAGGNQTGWNCSVKHLVTMCGASDRQVYRGMSDLERAGLLRRHRTGRSTRYELVSPGQLARVGKAPTPDSSVSSDSRGNTDRSVTTELTHRINTQVTDLSGDIADNDGQNRKPDALQKVSTETFNTTPPNPPLRGGGEGDMSDKSVQDAIRPRETSHVDTGKRPRGIRALHTWACGPHLKKWIHGRIDGLTGAQFEAERDLLLYHLESGAVIGSIANALGVRTRRAEQLLSEARPSALHYLSELQPEPFCLDKALTGYRERLEKQNLLDLAHACESEEELNEVLRDLVMRECGF